MPKNSSEQALHTRLRPLYAAAFLQNFVFFYAIEKLYMKSIGFGPDGVGVMVALYSIVMLATETPSGILADRWSRKGVLMLASISLALSTLVGALSHSPSMYLLAAALWGVFFALYSGTYDSIMYDTVLEETGQAALFDKLYGRIKIVESIGLVASSLIGGFIAQTTNLRLVYVADIPVALLAIGALAVFREPTLHKAHLDVSITEHLSKTFRAISRNRSLLAVMAALVCISTAEYMLFEFSQLWFIALAASLTLFGPANALMLGSTGLGGLLASHGKITKLPIMCGVLCVALLGTIGLTQSRNVYLTIALQVATASMLVAILIIFNRLLHDSLSSNIRAGAASAVSTLSRMCIIPLAFVFGQVVKAYSVFTAGWILVVLFTLGAYFVLQVGKRSNGQGLKVTS